MYRLTNEIREKSSWAMLFAGNVVLCGKSKEEVETELKTWKDALKKEKCKSNETKK